MTMKFQIEQISKVKSELEPLVIDHWKEVNQFDHPLSIAWNKYYSAEASGHYILITARTDDKLVGWVGYFIYELMRHQDYTIAREDWYYVIPEYRKLGIGSKLFITAEKALQERKVKRIIMSCKVKHDQTKLIESLGYEPLEKTFTKLLDTE
jgi:GNAT superfamily N-acetyltransferase